MTSQAGDSKVGSFVHKAMKKAVILLAIVLAYVPSVRAQSSCLHDSILVSLMPISWSIDWACYGPQGNTSGVWSGAFGPGAEWNSDSSSVIRGADSISFNVYDSPHQYHYLRITIDTVVQKIRSLEFRESNPWASYNGDVSLYHSVPYQVVGNARRALIKETDFSLDYSAVNCEQLYDRNGWISLGGASPAIVSTSQLQPLSLFSVRDLPDVVTFRFAPLSTSTSLHIIDLLGREWQTILICPGETSLDLKTSAFGPGIYFAKWNGEVRKFSVK